MIKPCHFSGVVNLGCTLRCPRDGNPISGGAHPSVAGQQAPIICSLIGQITASHRQLETINTGVHGKKRTPEDDPGLCNPFRKSIKLSAYRVRSSAEWSDGRVTRRILSQKITIRHKPTRFISISPKVK